MQYLAEWTQSTKQGVIKNLKNLVEKGLILKSEILRGSIKYCTYKINIAHDIIRQNTVDDNNEKFNGIKQSLMNNKIDNINNNIDNNNIDKSILLLDKSEESYGNNEINEMFDKWNELFGYKPKNSNKSRFAVYNMLRAKDKGKEWLVKTMLILREAQKDKYAGNAVLSIANFSDLQQNYDKVWKWGSGQAMRNQETSRNIEI